MAITRNDFHNKFNNGDIPSHADFVEIFDNFVNKEDDKADFQMVETGTDNEHYITPALLKAIFQNSGILSGNCYSPFKEYKDSFTGSSIELEYPPIENSVKVFKNGQLLEEDEDYELNYNTGVIIFSEGITSRNIEANYWFKNINPTSGGSDSMFGKASIPYKENFSADIFNSDTITLKKTPLKYSSRIYKNGQLLRENKDYSIVDGSKIITFSAPISNRNIEVDYWYEGPISLTDPELNTKYVDLTSNQSIKGNKTFTEMTESKGFIKTGGTSNQYLMADGSVSTSTASDYDAGHSPFNTSQTSGFQKFSNGLILQWAYLSSGSTTYSFPIAWPAKACSVVLSTYRIDSGNKGFNHVYDLTNTTYKAIIDGPNGYMFAIGY
ncbi:gp53-like domain-containing protein [Flavobacterium johnsoniae]|uniref:Putative tail fiber protein gp53-like C-terminal domain-containing protein n=1 Tax=Flavobacterium johnsoniae (strain ATCC 17061 / DSM 2064 / JCM 8514 / BCRC 14874 / CCUG 350202 / NBRC 14942 / NCIMB 11054 / UW101) TaxID=376686 RepID=A5FI81_FLAJ1|nr:hypothetical protein [Flavobacterium johnsoniae]ABQ05088.1 hypothetical protein Fjoh_2057 [Flavobacterium johnsoniae UW101]OXG00339.1 hypothetical protein B0A63_09395 [Flavobacterium johnsoniae UW101]WQG83111.1 hypothetical protein SR927_08320 [Flavobacterium johnsoniae UW101]SHL91212.1 hypothetical protein SAMN05444146_4935 [Flavobacterium johnsoniae]